MDEQRVRPVPQDRRIAVAPLFDGWQETMILSCLQGVMGELYTVGDAVDSAAAVLGDFCFFAGRPEARLVRETYRKQFLILTPQNEDWSRLIEQVHGDRAQRRTRYAIRKEPDCFDPAALQRIVDGVPAGFTLRPVDEALYYKCLANGWSRDLVSNFPTWTDYARLGLGVVALSGEKLVSGASSYTRYQEGIEIEIDTHPDYRRRGLAAACGAALILACLKRGLYPSWDAQNPGSVALAEKLGYHFSHAYPVYEVTTPSRET